MKNDYLEKIVNRMYGGQEVSRAQRDLAWAYKKPAYRAHGRICLDMDKGQGGKTWVRR